MAAAKYTNQWLGLAGLKKGVLSEERVMAAKLAPASEIAERKAMDQFGLLISLWAQALDKGMSTQHSLAEDILAKLAEGLKKYRGNAYGLSEKQIQVILNHLNGWLQ